MKLTVIALTCLLVAGSRGFSDEIEPYNPPKQPGFGKKAMDALIIRPLGVASTAFGGALYIISYPVAAVAKGTNSTKELLVAGPAHSTFKRPLGDLDAMAY